MIYYVYDTTNNNVYNGQSKHNYTNSTTIAPPALDRDKYCYDITNTAWVIDQTFLTAEAAKKKQERINSLLTKFNNLCNQKIRDAFEYYTGNVYSELLISRYKSKYASAKRYVLDGNKVDEVSLQLEADFKGMTVLDFANLIIQMGDAYNVVINELNIKIDAMRVKIKDMLLVKGDITNTKLVLAAMETLPFNATNANIKAIFPV